MANKKTVLAYFLQKTGGTYTEQSLLFLLDLLQREGVTPNGFELQELAAEIATLVRDGSHLHISTKRLPAHIRTQIDFSLNKAKKTKSPSRSQQSAFDDLLASLDSDDPRFTMDTTLGLDFSSLEDLESDLKKHAMDSISPSVFARRQPQAQFESAENDMDVASDSFAVTDSADFVAQDSLGASSSRQISAPDDSQEFTQDVRDLRRAYHAHSVPEFPKADAVDPSDSTMTFSVPTSAVPSFSHLPQQSFDAQPISAGSVRTLTDPSQTATAQAVLADIRTRAALVDAKEKLLMQRVSSLSDPVLLKALAALDERFLALRAAASRPEVNTTVQNNPALSPAASLAPAASQIPDPIGAVKSQIEGLLSLKKTFDALLALGQPEQTETVRMRSAIKPEVTQLRQRISQLQEQIASIGQQIGSLSPQNSAHVPPDFPSQSFSPSTRKHARSSVSSAMSSSFSNQPVHPSVASVDRMRTTIQQARANVEFGNGIDIREALPTFSEDAPVFGADEPTLQKMYALLVVGNRELPSAPKRAKHIYEQLQRLYATLSADEKPLIYNAVVEFYAALSARLNMPGRRSQ